MWRAGEAHPYETNVVSTGVPTPVGAEWRDLHGTSGFDGSWHVRGDIFGEAAFPIASDRFMGVSRLRYRFARHD